MTTSLRSIRITSVLATALVTLPIGCGSSGDGNESSADSTGGDLPAGCDLYVEPSDDDQTAVTEAFVDATDGKTLCLAAGEYHLTRQLSLNANGVTVRGAGKDMTILDFTGQETGGNGMLVKGNDVTLTEFTVRNTPGDGIRGDQVENIAFVRVGVIWEAMHALSNGAYGLYPVGSNGVLIQECEVVGARDAGIYVGQSTAIVVEDSIAHDNVAGIEIENSTDAIVRRNESYSNTAGILVFNLPGLDVKDGKRANVYENDVHDNNVTNFADPGTVVGIVPPGVGMLVLAADNNEIHGNTIANNDSVGVAIIAYSEESGLFEPPNDPAYDIWSEGNYIHDNTFMGNGTMPDPLVLLLAGNMTPTPDVIIDGCIAGDKNNDDGSLSNCLGEGSSVTFMNADLCGDAMGATSDPATVACTQPALPTE
ncbi:MAG: right-handed parallel beta-helix repeat-containing protein [Nannocystaceae bacterium]|nr:right-handed parallel beta-helix repeat-containing protein [Nannocystaceae bacterium]